MEIHIPDMVWAIINFLILVVVLNKFLYKPLLSVMEERKEEIRKNMENAEDAKAEALKIKEKYSEEMHNARQEARSILERAEKLGEENKEKIIAEARQEADKITEKAQVAVRREKEEALTQLRNEVASLAIMAAEKIIDKNLDKKDHEKMIGDFIKEVGDVS